MRLLALSLAGLALTSPTPMSWRTFSADGVSVRYPPGWFATAQPLTAVTSPQQVIAIASYRYRPDIARADGCEPKEAFDKLPATGAFIYGWETGQLSARIGIRASDFPPRPKHFKLTGFGHYDCLGVAPGYMLSFSDHDNAFTIEIAFGKRATPATRATVLRILDSFTSKRS